MSCEMRSTITSYPHGSAMYTPPTFRCSATTPLTPSELMWPPMPVGKILPCRKARRFLPCRCPSKKTFLRHFVPPWPIVSEALPHVQQMRDLLRDEHVGHLHILIEKRVLIANREHIVVAAEVLEEPGVAQIGQVIERAVQVGVGIVVAVQKAFRDIESPGHADGVRHQFRVPQGEVDRMVAAEAASGRARLRPTRAIENERRQL